ncbi:MAG: sel1 repeat family protein [Thiobacillaceae bacterium]|nr:sel1 repeat family protein [Thiobacillaceae bacterium]
MPVLRQSAGAQIARRLGGWFAVTYRCRACKRHFKLRSYWGYAAIAALIAAAVGVVATSGLFTADGPLQERAADEVAASVLSREEVIRAYRGEAAMQYKLGMHLWDRMDYRNGFKWIKAAADQGHTEAVYQMGMAYLYGLGTLQNYKQAYEWFAQAARLHKAEAQYLLGVMHRDGMGVPVSRDHAYAWLNIAAANGNEAAALERERLAQLMTPAEMTRAQEISLQLLQGATHAHGAPNAATARP